MRGTLAVIEKFTADRGTHLAAMIAYFALLAFVPLLFLALSLIALAGEQSESSYLIEQLRRAFPATSVDRLLEVVQEVQDRGLTFGIVGAIALLWATLGFFSVVESAFNIVYGLPNRSFIRQKSLVLVLTGGSLVLLFCALVVSSIGAEVAANATVIGGALAYVYALAISTALVLGFVWIMYTLLTNERLRWRETLPGALFAALLLQASFQILPLFVRGASGLVSLQAFGGLVLLLFWLYLMANVVVFGAEINWWLARGRASAPDEPPAGLA